MQARQFTSMFQTHGLDWPTTHVMPRSTQGATEPIALHAPASRLKIALIVDRFGTHFGGAEAYAVHLARDLAARHDITIIARTYDSELDLPFIKVAVNERLPSWMRLLCFVRAARRIVKHHAFDIVHSHANSGVGDIQVVHVTPVRAKKGLSRPVIRTLKMWTSPRLATYLLLEKARMRRVPGRRVVAVSRRIDCDLNQSYAGLATTIIGPGVRHTGCERDNERRAATRRHLGCGENHVVCLLVARNPLRKGLRVLLNVVEVLPAHYRLVVVGADQAAQQALEQHPDLAGRVRLIGPTHSLDKFYEAADIYVHPTLDDAFGMAPLEAMAHGLPVVISAPRHCGLAEHLTDGENALLLNDPHDACEIAQALARLAEDSLIRARLCAGGLAVARAHSWQNTAHRFECLYRESLDEKQRQDLG